MKKKYFVSILLIIFCIFLSRAVMSEDNIPQNRNHDQMNSRLIEEQKEELKATVEGMKNAGASKEEIRSAVKDLLKSWGITPQNQGNQSQRRELMSQLTEEQQQLLKTKIEEMKNAGASKEEIRSAVGSLLKSWAVTPQSQGNQSQSRDWMSRLTEDQKKELKLTVEAMKNDGASKEEIKSVVKNMLKTWGITPQKQENQSQRREWMNQLTEEQKQELKATLEEMKNAGASKEEIRSTVKKMLKNWGITPQNQQKPDRS
jgi:alkylhydroperoxidase/carboxymuconolactone decarboxylase family protein YurZ